jgi:hypothetical protein
VTAERRRAENLRYELAAAAREATWTLLAHHRPGPRRDICVFAVRRGGSTWLMELIAANRGMRPLNQPFSANSGNITASAFRALPKLDLGMVIHLDPETEPRFTEFADAVMRGEIAVNAPSRFWERDFRFRTDRQVLKIVDANPLIDWFATRYDVEIVYLTRHPIPQALSCMRNGWTVTARAFLRNEWFVEHELDPDLVEYARGILGSGTTLERHVLGWVLENLVPMRLLPERPSWHWVAYEDCVLEPEATVRRLASALDLTDVDAMLRRVRRPSRSSHFSPGRRRGSIEAGRQQDIVGGWQAEVDADDERRAFDIVEHFGIDVYRAGDPHPAKPLA